MGLVKFSELDNLLRHFDEGYLTSHDEAYRRFSESHLAPPDDLPSDPFSEEYAALLGRDVHGRSRCDRGDRAQNDRAGRHEGRWIAARQDAGGSCGSTRRSLWTLPRFAKSKSRAELELTLTGPMLDGVTVDVCCSRGQVQPFARPCTSGELQEGVTRLDFSLADPVD